MEKFARFDGPNIVSTDGNKSDRPSAAIDKLNLVSDTAFVNMHHVFCIWKWHLYPMAQRRR